MNGIDVEEIRKQAEWLVDPANLANSKYSEKARNVARAYLSLLPAESTGIAQVGDDQPAHDVTAGKLLGVQPLRTKAAPATQQAGDDQPPSFLDAILKWYGNLRRSAQRSLSFDDMHTLAKTLSDLRSATLPVAAADGATTREDVMRVLKSAVDEWLDSPVPGKLCDDYRVDALIAARPVTVSDGAVA